MSKLLSDEELLIEIQNVEFGGQFLKNQVSSGTIHKLYTLINNQKRLYALEVIGKDVNYEDIGDSFKSNYFRGRNELRAEQRARIK